MAIPAILEQTKMEAWSDQEIVSRVLAGETALYELIMRRYNQRLYRAVRAILRDENETEDVMQDAYVRAYQHLNQFAGRSQFSTWLTRIAVHEAFARLRQRGHMTQLDEVSLEADTSMLYSKSENPEQYASKAELGKLLEEAILNLPEQFRSVVMLRDVEEMCTAETADALEISQENVKTRLHRGHALLRKELLARVSSNASSAFPFMGERCDRVVVSVLQRINAL
ncbi:MAG: RNA polymerase sigma factor [Acidobacteria bacterium]|nr:MAG: RNA polymerase sigma factor [Acidobacteriota bacterium]